MISRAILMIGMISFVLGFSSEAKAETIRGREINQQRRIAQGVKSGQLTARETVKLEKGEKRIEKAREKAWSDGKLSPRERGRLQHAENRESKQIYQMKHNARRR